MDRDNGAKLICRSLDNLAKEVKWLRLMMEEVLKKNGRKEPGEDDGK